MRTLLTVGSAADDRWRLAQLVGAEPTAGHLLRSPSSSTPWGRRSGVSLAVLTPDAQFAWNSEIPFSMADGAMWAGRGGSSRVMAGVLAEAGPVRVVVAPELVWSQNQEFDALLPETWSTEQRRSYLAPWLTGRHSVDLPYRFGDGPIHTLHPGQSSVSVRVGPAVLGAATENQWWGPGIRNAILFSNNAPGYPHLFARSSAPLRTPLGAVEAKWLVGALSPSRYAPRDSTSPHRSISAAAFTLQPGFAPGLTLGIARAVYSPVDEPAGVVGRFADVLGHWDAGRDSTGRAAEQMLALSARWVMPAEGAEVYVEWARGELPTSVRDLLLQPEHSQGYTVGGQVARPVGGGSMRLQAEHTYLEESPTLRSRPIGSYYASQRVRQGYTHQGQLVGAAVGPGGSGQWLALDYFRGTLQAGAFAGRVRWANDAYYDKPGGHNRYRAHDVTIMGGLRGGAQIRGLRWDADWTVGKRHNFLFQNPAGDWDQRHLATNVLNHTLGLRISAAVGPRR